MMSRQATTGWKAVLASDLSALGSDKWRWRFVLTQRIAWFMRRLRIAEHYAANTNPISQLLYPLHRLWLARLSERLGFDIPLGVLAPGVSIAHVGTIVINGGATVGSGCRLHPGVTIGASRGVAPVVEDDVFIGPNVVIVGGVTVGKGAIIGPLALITEDVEPGKTCLAPKANVRDVDSLPWNSPRRDASV